MVPDRKVQGEGRRADPHLVGEEGSVQLDQSLQLLVERFDYALAYIGITMVLYFYGEAWVKKVVRKIEGSAVERFVIFGILVLFGLNIILVLLTEFLLSITQTPLKWVLILALNVWGFILFDRKVLKG